MSRDQNLCATFRFVGMAGNEPGMTVAMLSTVRTEFGSRHFNPTVAKDRDRGVLFCAGGETRRLIPRYRKGLRR